ncbi:hypothetical protein M23134_07961 [Microscilla marina ATCC 23134]|uniref:Uncharacterized protein n=1 Tax=Microscilla marina ATCC 23134 TaxID=313606 RepID=A1ZWI5_MICM2|nr:hypothetical protein M23134_07961 [Microscilla marina ATCC 23134]
MPVFSIFFSIYYYFIPILKRASVSNYEQKSGIKIRADCP